MQETTCATVVHHKKNKIRCFSTKLQPNAAAFQRIHGWRAPRTGEVLTSAAYHCAATVAATDNKGGFQHRRHHDNTTSLIDQVLRNVVRNLEDLLHDSSCVLKTILGFCFAHILCGRQWSQGQQARHSNNAALCEVHFAAPP